MGGEGGELDGGVGVGGAKTLRTREGAKVVQY